MDSAKCVVNGHKVIGNRIIIIIIMMMIIMIIIMIIIIIIIIIIIMINITRYLGPFVTMVYEILVPPLCN